MTDSRYSRGKNRLAQVDERKRRGMSNREIAADLGLSVSTVVTYVAIIRTKRLKRILKNELTKENP